jgi:ADP-ribose pyrophosphatase YjhB (NUDIX family)
VPRQLALTEAELKWTESIGDEGKEREAMQHPTDVQIIASLVVRRTDGRVLLVRCQHEDERWWLPGEDLEPYEHPDEAARRILGLLPGLRAGEPTFSHYESFRGRRGWHVVFHYLVEADGEAGGGDPTDWFDPVDLPRTMHGRWERENVERALGGARETLTG